MDYEKLYRNLFTSNNSIDAVTVSHFEGRIYIGQSADYLISIEQAEKIIAACHSYIGHISENEIENYNKFLRDFYITKDKEINKVLRQKAKVNGLTNLYLILNKRSGYYKIGKAANVSLREKTLQSEEPELELIHTMPAFVSDEYALHTYFADKRIRGEWFKLSTQDVVFIKNYKPASL